MVISLDAIKYFDDIYHIVIKELLERFFIQGTYINIIKTIYEIPIVYISLLWEKFKTI